MNTLTKAQADALELLSFARERGDEVYAASRNNKTYCSCCYRKIHPVTARSLERMGYVTVRNGIIKSTDLPIS